MAITAAQLIARVSVEGASAAQGQLLGVGSAADATEARFRSLAVIGSGVLVAGLIAVAAVSVKMAADFQQAVTRLRTGAGDTQDSFATLASGILKVSTATGLMSGPLTKAMYEILSSGQRGAQAFETLSAAAKGAVIEQANVVDVSDTLAGAMTNFGTRTFGAVAYMNGLIAAVSRGRITLQDLSTAMGPIEPVAHAMGISFSDLAAAMSTQTNAAIPAARAATGLRFMMQSLEVPTTKAKDAMAAMGLSSVAVANEMKVSLPGALQMVYNAAKKAGPEGSVPFNQAVSDMVGGQRALATFLALTGTHMKDFSANAKAIAASMRTGAGDVNGWAIAQTNFNVILDRAKAAIGAAAIGLGLLLLPALGRIVGIIPQIVDYFSNFSQHANVLIPILAGVATVIASFLVPAVIALAVGVIAATWPVLAIGAAVAGLVAIFMHFYSTNAGFKAFIDNLVTGFRALWTMIQANFMPTLQRLGAFFQGTILPILQQVGAFLITTFAPVWKQLVETWNSQVLPALKQLWTALVPLMPILKLIGEVILGVIVVALGILFATLIAVIKGLAGFLTGLVVVIGGIIQVFSGVVQILSGVVRFIYDLLTGNFSKLGADLGAIWRGIVTMFTGVWNVIKGLFQAAWGFISGVVSGFVSGIIGYFQTLANALVGHSIIPDMINAIVGWFLSLPGKALSAVSGLLGQLSGFFGNLAGQAFSWGANIIAGIANGIWSMIGNVTSAAQSVANTIANFLPHSPAKEGPLKDLEYMGTQIPAQLAAGMRKNVPAISASLTTMLSPLVALPSITPSPVLARNTSTSAAPIHVNVYLDGAPVAKKLMPHIATAIRQATGAKF